MILLLGASALRGETQVDCTLRIAVEQSFTDNFFQDSEHQVDMWVTRVAPGFNLRTETENSVLLLDYIASHYWHFTEERGIKASDQNFLGHDLYFGVATQPSIHWKLGFSEELIKAREPLLSVEELTLAPLEDEGFPPPGNDRPGDFLDIRANLVDFTRSRAEPFLYYYPSERWGAKFSYRNEVFNLSSDDPDIDRLLENQMEHRGVVTLTYSPGKDNHFDIENQFWHRDFNAHDSSNPLNSDYNAYQANIVYRRDAKESPYELRVGAGRQHRTFTQDVDGLQMDSLNEFVFSAELSRKTAISKITLSLERSINDFTISNNYYVFHTLGLAAQRYLCGRKVRLFGKGSYEIDKYLTNAPGNTPRKEDAWEFEGGGAYTFFKERLELALGFNYADRDSNRPGLDYNVNKVFLKLEVRHDLNASWK